MVALIPPKGSFTTTEIEFRGSEKVGFGRLICFLTAGWGASKPAVLDLEVTDAGSFCC